LADISTSHFPFSNFTGLSSATFGIAAQIAPPVNQEAPLLIRIWPPIISMGHSQF
jgi:hypothetical protein